MHRFITSLITLSALVWLAACGGGGGSAASGVAPDPGPDIPVRPTPDTDPVTPGDLPASGRFAFSGQLSVAFATDAGNAPQTMTSPLSLAVDFGGADAQVSGEAGQFAGYDGRLFLSLGQIDRAAQGATPAIAGRIAGTLKQDSESYLVFGDFNGDFRGTAQDALSGRVAGSVLHDAVQSPLTGSYQAARIP